MAFENDHHGRWKCRKCRSNFLPEVWKRSAGLSAEIYNELRELKDFGFKDDHHGRWKCRKRRSGFLTK